MEPIFPEAALIPYAVDLYRVGKTSPGTMKVVLFGPALVTKLQRQNRTTRAGVEKL